MSPIPANLSEEFANQPSWQIRVFLALYLVGFILLTLLLLICLFSPKVYRVKTWYPFIGSWALYCMVHLFLEGYTSRGEAPPHMLCLVQAALVYAGPAFCGVASLAYVLEVSMRFGILPFAKGNNSGRYYIALLIFPPIIFVLVLIEALVVGIRSGPDGVFPNSSQLYCHMQDKLPFTVSLILVGLSTTVIIILQGMSFFRLWKNWKAFRSLSSRHTSAGSTPVKFTGQGRTDTAMSISASTFVRIALFMLLPLIALGLAAVSVVASDKNAVGRVWALAPPILPIATALVFGTQGDILRALICRGSRNESQHAQAMASSQTPVKEVILE